MSYASLLAKAAARHLGSLVQIRTAVPPFHLGGGVDVAEFSGADGSTAYLTTGLSAADASVQRPLAWIAAEYVVFADGPDTRLAATLSALGAVTRERKLSPHDTMPLVPATLADAVLFLHDSLELEVEGRSIGAVRVLGITAREREVAIEQGSRTLVAALAHARRAVRWTPGRATVPLDDVLRAHQHAEQVWSNLDALAYNLAGLMVRADGKRAEILRDSIAEIDIEYVRAGLAEVLESVVPSITLPEQLAVLLHACCDLREPLLASVGRRIARMVVDGLADRDPMQASYVADACCAIRAPAMSFDELNALGDEIRSDSAGAVARARAMLTPVDL